MNRVNRDPRARIVQRRSGYVQGCREIPRDVPRDRYHMETIVLTIWSHPLYPEHRAGEHEDARLCAGEIGRGFAGVTLG